MFLKWDGSRSERKEVDGEKQRCMCSQSSHIWFCHGVTQRIKMIKNDKKHNLKYKNQGYTYYNIPVHTCDTAAWVHSVLWCGKNQHHTHTHSTHFKSTAGLPVPVLNQPFYSPSIHTIDAILSNTSYNKFDIQQIKLETLCNEASDSKTLFTQ